MSGPGHPGNTDPIRLEHVSVQLGGVPVLRDVTLNVERGEFLAIIGASGGGKSTLLRCINGLEGYQEGSIKLGGMTITDRDSQAREISRSIGMVFQSFNLFPHMTALENVMLAPRRVLKKSAAECRELAQRMLEKVGLGDRLDYYPSSLSGGQQQRVAIARALVNSPPILLADEPTGALDSKTGEEILALFKRLRDDGHTVVLITHDAHVAEHADRVFIIRDGELHEGQPEDLRA